MQLGEVIAGRYELVDLAGEGGMGTVYRAVDHTSGASVALKVAIHAHAEAERRFHRETRILSALSHPGIVRALDHGVSAEGTPFLVMEWLVGEDLSQRLASGPLGMGPSLELACRVASALGAAHRCGVVHRDLKPANIFLPGGDVGSARILDFGIARGGQATKGTAPGTVLGTAAYMAPEQVLRPDGVGPRADVYALGAVLYESLTGRGPLGSGTDLELLGRLLSGEPAPAVSVHLQGVPGKVDTLVARLLARREEHRPADGAEALVELKGLLEELRGVPGGEPVVARRAAVSVAEMAMGFRVMAEGPVDVLAAASRLARELGMSVEGVGTGVVVVSVEGDAAVDELAVRAARLALRFRDQVGVERLAITFARMGGPADDATSPHAGTGLREGVHLDELAAVFLDARYDVERTAEGCFLRGARGGRASALPGAEGPISVPFLGRARELRLLVDAYAACAEEGRAHSIFVVGGAGSGKSRLLREFLSAIGAMEPTPTVVLGESTPEYEGSPLALFASALGPLLGVSRGMDAAESRVQVRLAVERLVPGGEHTRQAAFLSVLLGVAGDDEPSLQNIRRDPVLLAEGVKRSLEDVLAGAAAEAPLVLVFDDVQWSDAPTRRMLAGACRFLREHRVLTVVFARAEGAERPSEALGFEGFEELVLRPLARGMAERFARHILGEGAEAARVAAVVANADGNPFALEELGRVARLHPRDVVKAPRSVLALAEDRLRQVDADGRRVLRAGCVLGVSFPVAAVEALLGGAGRDVDVRKWCETLETRGILSRRREGRGAAQEEYAFAHPLLRDAAEASLPLADRRRAHVAAAEWLESVGEPDSALVAQHYERGGEWSRAGEWFERAVEVGMRGDLHAALELVERALACGAVEASRGRLLVRRAEALAWLGRRSEVGAPAREALGLLPVGSEAWFRAVGELTEATVADPGSLAVCIEALDAAPAGSKGSGPGVVALARSANVAVWFGQSATALRLLGEASLSTSSVDPLASAWMARARASEAWVRGDASAAAPFYELASAAFARAGETRQALLDGQNASCMTLQLGELEKARAAMEGQLAEARRLGVPGLVAGIQENLGLAWVLLDRPGEAEVVLRTALAERERTGERRGADYCRVYLARAALSRAPPALGEAWAALEPLVWEAPQDNQISSMTYARAVRAQVHLGRGEVELALRDAELAYRTLERVELEEGDAWVRLAYGEALLASGRTEDARGVFAIAAGRLRERASRLPDEAARDMFLSAFPEHRATLAHVGEEGSCSSAT